MIRKIYSDDNLLKRLDYCSEDDLEALQGILNEPHPNYSTERHKSYESKEHISHEFLKFFKSLKDEPQKICTNKKENNSSYEDAIDYFSKIFGMKNKHKSLLEKEKQLTAAFFKIASTEISEENISTAQKKCLKFKPDLLAKIFCDEMRNQKTITGLLLLAAGIGCRTLADTLQKFSFQEITALAFISKLHFVIDRHK